jgi:pimeloyl-ACP methyl ester carboxylesterase
MGGMLATRFALMFPQSVHKLILENPIGFANAYKLNKFQQNMGAFAYHLRPAVADFYLHLCRAF